MGRRTRKTLKGISGGGPSPNEYLLVAAGQGNLAALKSALDAGANIELADLDGYTSLLIASEDGTLNVVKELIARGANIEATDNRGDTSLSLSSYNGHLSIVKELIAAGANVNAVNKLGMTSLIYASSEGHLEIVRELLARGANIEAADVYGNTSLLEASEDSRADVVKLLLEKGADTTKKTKDGKTVYDLAKSQEVRDLLRKYRIDQRVAVAITGAHPESTMPNPDVASVIGKFLGGERRKTRKLKLKSIKPSHKAEKKWDATFVYPDGHQKVVPFGAKGMSDYTKHRDPTRKQRYLKRHSGMGESWQKPDTPGALAKWVLWNKKTLRASISDYKRRFKL